MKKSYGEWLMCKYLELILGKRKRIDNYRPNWLKNPKTGRNLELDRYYPQLRVGFEYQGQLHFLSKRKQQLDKLKRKLCKQEGIVLIQVIGHDLNSPTMLSKVNYVLGKRRRKKIKMKTISRKNQTLLKQLNDECVYYRKALEKKYGKQINTHKR